MADDADADIYFHIFASFTLLFYHRVLHSLQVNEDQARETIRAFCCVLPSTQAERKSETRTYTPSFFFLTLGLVFRERSM